MPIKTITFNGKFYPALQSDGNAMQFAIPTFKKLIPEDWRGYDIGCNRPEWAYPGAEIIDPEINNYHAMRLPVKMVDFIVSSHMLEHFVGRFQDVIEFWLTKIAPGGLICLYLPNFDYQKYWAWGNKKHVHYLSPGIMNEYCEYLHMLGLCTGFFVSEGYDMNGSFYCIIEK